MKTKLLILLTLVLLPVVAQAEITRIWLNHRTNDPSKIVVSWESASPGNSVVQFGCDPKPLQTDTVEESVTLRFICYDWYIAAVVNSKIKIPFRLS